ncbi:PREDICTED: uncharacterized protein LOC106297338 isoform X2 [Brassica oleracea var. oleracea]|uniref:uncharacterized protein LOC106297338 isoform X2 n=1 Tax=Brassica oleracea var. oleracea TaxID=109376 RepID=UPI0006A6A714|nr:PREDICTED: uncharacterized protein LOC106297338 isoform X2 [Brassica oleracea var. oleracea]
MASSDVVLAHSAFDALQVGRSAQIIVEDIFIVIITYRKASVRTTSQETKAKSLIQYTFIYLHRGIIRNQKSQNQSNAWLMLGGREQGGTKKTIHYLENSFDSALTS